MKDREIDKLLNELIQLVRAANVHGITPAQRAMREQTLAERHEAVRDKISDAFDAMRERLLKQTRAQGEPVTYPQSTKRNP